MRFLSKLLLSIFAKLCHLHLEADSGLIDKSQWSFALPVHTAVFFVTQLAMQMLLRFTHPANLNFVRQR
jgi:hypothetical protein